MAEFRIETERLVLRAWRDDDVLPLHALCNDPRVMEHLGPLQSHAEIEAAIGRQREWQAVRGHCYWALQRKADSRMIGFCGLQPLRDDIPVIGGDPDIGWRLEHAAWGQGFALEAARAALGWGFANLKHDVIWAITVPGNARSWGLMERLGMQRRDDLAFDHPAVPDDSLLKRHIVYERVRSADDR